MSASIAPSVSADALHFTPAASAMFAEIMKQAETGILGIRIYVAGGGCSGPGFGMTYADAFEAQDSVVSGDGFKLAVDTAALDYLAGAEIDFADGSFIFNTLKRSGGGCGSGGCGGGGCGSK
ncbi:MAG TPA: iron-sulfur cluster biosynthesis family protein [Burkholderiales bacterium]|nr:iron-sulfur cluster biosynthesis family protein [Burkholderiales bacterium]